jgi:predicted O-methyltransferase YrrM
MTDKQQCPYGDDFEHNYTIDLARTCPSCGYCTINDQQTHAAWCNTFEHYMELTRTVSSNAAFEDPECEAYFNLLMSLPPHALVIEVGLQFGRSSAIALQVAKANNLRYWGVDPFIEPPEAEAQWLEMAKPFQPFKLSKMKSNEVIVGEPIDLVLIDGDHSYKGVSDDCGHFLPHVRQGGFACFHDYGRESLPEVYAAVRDYMDGNQHWINHAHVGTLGVWQRA